MDPLVVKHILFLGKTFPTYITDPWLLPGVYSSMKLQLTLTDKPDTIDLLVYPSRQNFKWPLPSFTVFTHPRFISIGMRLLLVSCDT